MFSAYDAMPVPEGGSSGSAASSSQTQDSKLKQLMKALVDSNAVKLPEEARHLLEDNPEEDMRSEMRQAQNSLNKRRKAHGRVHRLKAAIAQKHEQFDVFKRKLRDFLHEQQEKYDEDIRSLEQNLKEAEANLQTLLDAGEATMEETMEPEQDLEQLLESKPREQRIVSLEQQLMHSKSETQATKQMFNAQAAQLQSYMQKLEVMQHALLHYQGDGKGPASPSGALTLGGKGAESPSPQLTKPPLHNEDPLAKFNKDYKKRKTTEPGVTADVINVDGSPESKSGQMQGMDWMATMKAARMVETPLSMVGLVIRFSILSTVVVRPCCAPIFQGESTQMNFLGTMPFTTSWKLLAVRMTAINHGAIRKIMQPLVMVLVAMVAIEKKRPTIKALVSTGIRHELVALSKNGSNIFGGSCWSTFAQRWLHMDSWDFLKDVRVVAINEWENNATQ